MQRLDKLNVAQKRWTRNPKEPRNPRKSSLQLRRWKWIETVKNKLKDARISKVKNKLKDARIAKIKNASKVEKLQWMHTMD